VATSGDVLLAAGGAAGDVALNADVQAGRHATVLASGDVTQSADIDAGTSDASGTIDIEAFAGLIAMADGTVARTRGGNIRYAAEAAVQDVTLGLLDARTAADRAAGTLADQANWGDVQVLAGRDILDARGDTAGVDPATGFAQGEICRGPAAVALPQGRAHRRLYRGFGFPAGPECQGTGRSSLSAAHFQMSTTSRTPPSASVRRCQFAHGHRRTDRHTTPDRGWLWTVPAKTGKDLK